jgi:GR25 family glycosyltransferase involved in LPS biosynthesis
MWEWCDAAWICTTTKYEQDPQRLPRTRTLAHDVLQIPKPKLFVNTMPHGNRPTHGLCCTENHLTCYKNALRHNHGVILVLEDDVDVHKHVDLRRTLANVTNFVRNAANTWNLLFFGCFAQQMDADKDIVSRRETYTIRRAACWSLHGYVINRKTMQWMAQFEPEDIVEYASRQLKKMPLFPDRVFQSFAKHPSLDGFYVLCARSNQLQCYTLYPHLFFQHSYKSSQGYSYLLEPVIAATGDSTFVILWIILIALCILMIPVMVLLIRVRSKTRFQNH